MSDREEKRRGIVEAAARLFASQGFTTVRVADIAVAADVGKGTVYEYFASKEELFLAVFEWINVTIRDRVDRALDEREDACSQIRALFRAGGEVVRDYREIHPMNLDFWAVSRGGAVETRFEELCGEQYRAYRELIAAIVRRGQETGELRADTDAEAVATMAVSVFDGLSMQHWLDPSVDPVASCEGFAEVVCRGLETPTAA